MRLYHKLFTLLTLLGLLFIPFMAQAQDGGYDWEGIAALGAAQEAWKAAGYPEKDMMDALKAFAEANGRTAADAGKKENTIPFKESADDPFYDWNGLLTKYRGYGLGESPTPPPSEPVDETPAPSEPDYLEQFKGLEDEFKRYQDLWKYVNDNMDGAIDWEAIAEEMGFPPSNPDDTYQRLRDLNEISKGWDGYMKDKEDWGMSDEDWMRWYLGQNPNDKGNYCLLDSKSCLEGNNDKINDIKNRPTTGEPAATNPNKKNNKLGFIDVTTMLEGLRAQIPSLLRLLVALSYVTGFAFGIIAVMKLKHIGERNAYGHQGGGFAGAISYAVVGAILIYFPTMVQVSTNTFMSGGGDFGYSYSLKTTGMAYESLVMLVADIVRLVGYIAFFRGWLILVKTGSGQQQHGTMSKGIIHIVGGIFAVNILTSWEILRATFGYSW
ncbi:MAG: hypothetical protein QM752_05090 [Gammaproteobacteria bacterium]